MRPVRYTQVKLQRQDPECTPCPNCIPSSAGPVKRNKHSPHFFTGSVRTRRSSPLADPSPVGGCTFSSSRLQPREPRSLTESSAGGHYELMDARALPRAEVHTLRESAHTLTYLLTCTYPVLCIPAPRRRLPPSMRRSPTRGSRRSARPVGR